MVPLRVWQFRNIFALVFVVFLLGGCKDVLYHQLDERSANRAVSILRQFCINALKASANGGVFNISVPKKDFTKSVMVLRTAGLPEKKFESLGTLFLPSGLVPTPFEEKVRYGYGLSQEVEKTLSMIEGVLDVRAHVALNVGGNEIADGQTNQEPRISVYIRYDDNYDVFSLVPQIKKVVADSVYDVDYENVVVLALPSSEEKPSRSRDTVIKCDQKERFYLWLFGTLLLGISLLSGGMTLLWWKGFFSRKPKDSPKITLPKEKALIKKASLKKETLESANLKNQNDKDQSDKEQDDKDQSDTEQDDTEQDDKDHFDDHEASLDDDDEEFN